MGHHYDGLCSGLVHHVPLDTWKHGPNIAQTAVFHHPTAAGSFAQIFTLPMWVFVGFMMVKMESIYHEDEVVCHDMVLFLYKHEWDARMWKQSSAG